MIDKEEYAAGRYGLYITEAYYGVFRYNIKPNESIVKNVLTLSCQAHQLGHGTLWECPYSHC